MAALDALGYAGAPEPAALVASVIEGRQGASRCMLPPVLVAAAGEPLQVGLSVGGVAVTPPTGGSFVGPVQWTVELEDGSRRSGRAVGTADGAGVAGVELPALPAGRHRLRVALEGPSAGTAEAVLLVAPPRCHLPAHLADGARDWGLAVQLYAVRSARNWGIGDFTDLCTLIDAAAALGARVIGLNPLHALALDRPEQASPYSAVSRLFLHPLYIDPFAVDVFRDPDTARRLGTARAPEARRAALRASDRVDYAGVCQLKLDVLRALYEAFVHHESGSAAAAEFAAFRRRHPALELHATFQSIQGALHARDPAIWGWPCWPEPLRDPDSPAVAQWQHDHAHDVGFHAFLEWAAQRQWAKVRRHARAAGVVLYGDLALGANRGGSEVWGAQRDHALMMSAGCPPDDFNLQGQDWGLPPLRPDRLASTGCSAFREAISANMAHFDALRLDHVMSLMRLFWIPPGQTPAAGAYVDYPFDALLATLKIESVRQHCMVIGEDLGTVPPAVRDGLQAADVLSYRLLVFERDAPAHFRLPDAYPRLALAALGSHDLAPIQGWWSGDDLRLRARIGLLDAEQLEHFTRDRAEARRGLFATLRELGLLPPEEDLSDPAVGAPLSPALVAAVHAFLARTAAMWALVNVEDAFGLVDATNVPGTTHQHPNWSRKLPVPVEDWATHAGLRSIAKAMQAVRRSRSPDRASVQPGS